MKDSLLIQLKKRRLNLGLKQKDMMLRIGISRQQYQHLESRGNPRLDILELVAKGLNSEIMLIPKEKLSEIKTVLANNTPKTSQQPSKKDPDKKDITEDPWQDLLKDE